MLQCPLPVSTPSLLPLLLFCPVVREQQRSRMLTLNKIKHNILMKKRREEKGGRREWEVRRQWVVRAKQEKIFTFASSSHHSLQRLMSLHWIKNTNFRLSLWNTQNINRVCQQQNPVSFSKMENAAMHQMSAFSNSKHLKVSSASRSDGSYR